MLVYSDDDDMKDAAAAIDADVDIRPVKQSNSQSHASRPVKSSLNTVRVLSQ